MGKLEYNLHAGGFFFKRGFLFVGGRPPPFKKGARPPIWRWPAPGRCSPRQPFAASDIDEAIVGCVIPAPDEANIARIVALRLGCGKHVPAYTVQRNCASGLQALASAAERIALGYSNLVLAGGTEAMSRAPIQWNAAMTGWLAAMLRARGPLARLAALGRFRPAYLKPVYSLLLGLTDPLVKLSMGQTAEVLAHRFGITRAAMDAYALESHQRLASAYDADHLQTEIEPLYDTAGNAYTEDNGLRRDTDLNRLGKLPPVFDRDYGLVTAGNSAQVTDGATMLLLASEDAVARHGLTVLGEWLGHEWAGVEPEPNGSRAGARLRAPLPASRHRAPRSGADGIK